MFVADMFKSRRRLEAETLFLRHQLKIALRRAPPRPSQNLRLVSRCKAGNLDNRVELFPK
jgi:hypothetical protein